MNLKTEFNNNDLTFTCECSLDKKYLVKDPFLLMQSLITEANTIKMKYLRSLEGDNDIIGQEKGDIIDEIEKFINTLFYVQQYIKKSFSMDVSENLSDSKVQILMEKTKYRINGKIDINDTKRGDKVAEFYEKFFIKSLSDAILIYKKAAEDKKITQSEAKDILIKLSYVFYEAILLRYVLEYCLINE